MCAKLVASYPRRLEAVITGKSASTMYRVKGLNTYCVCVCSLIDRVFGRCLELPSADLYTYDVSASALQHLRTLLQKLSHRGTVCLSLCLPACLSVCLTVPVQMRVYVKITHSRSFFKHQSTLHLTSVCVCVQMCRAFNHPLFSLSSQKGSLRQIPVVKESHLESGQFMVLTIISMVLIMGALAVSGWLFCLRHRSHLQLKEKLASLGTDTSADATATYQELCRQRMAVRTSERAECPEPLRRLSRLNSSSSQFSDGGPIASPSARSSTSSWCEEPVPSNMDISTGHMILSYMEDHLKNKNRLEREWEAMCGYLAEPGDCDVGQGQHNTKRNRSDAVVVYDHSRITLKAENNHGNSDYINASPIMDHDPRNPMYIASQGPLPSTVADFWQMVWESGCVVIVMLTPLSENGVKQCQQYWPDEGSNVYHVYEVNLVSEHIWCEDFLVRSFYLKNLQTNETRTVTQFHFLSWVDHSIPDSARTLLDFRRKVNKCYRGRSCPIIVHCSDGAGRSGTYILIDMVLNRMAKGAKEIDIAATLEHLRDQRAGMVQTKEQFELALTAVAEEVNAILKALPQ
uniref:Protein tyrosine phosphatase receptor type N2 n=1 Tax=Oncorhynchus mykiss TaxID=8022 RepID=A0A8C7Q5F7_ONCMY